MLIYILYGYSIYAWSVIDDCMTLNETQKLQIFLLLNEKRLKVQKQLSAIEKDMYEHESSICDHNTNRARGLTNAIVS